MSDALTWPDGTLVELADIHSNADAAKDVAASPLEGSTIRTPDWVIGELIAVSQHAARMVVVIERAEAYKRRAGSLLERARAKARWEHRHLPATQQAAQVVLLTVAEKDEYDLAVAAFEYARRIGNLLKDYTSRVQSIGKQVELVYRDAGRGL